MTYSIRKSRQGSSRIFILLIAVGVFLLILSLIGFGAHQYYQSNLQPVSQTESSQLIIVEPGATTQQVAELLQDESLIRSSWAFAWYMRSNDLRDKIQAGTYALSPSMMVAEIADIITRGGVGDVTTFTVFPERRIDQIRDNLINDAGFSPEEADEALDPAQYEGHPALLDKPIEASLEGYLYPETFQINSTTTAVEIIEQSLDQMASYLSPATKAGFEKQGLSVHEGIILASIVEREVDTINPDDRSQVAQVFLSRLATDTALESNATASYGAVLDGAELSESYTSPYNTYQNPGLPPGPVSNVSISSLKAVANPANTDFLYFVSGDRDDEGVSVTYFSRTLEEHEEKVRQYCTEACR
jgi:UPF0755 protein